MAGKRRGSAAVEHMLLMCLVMSVALTVMPRLVQVEQEFVQRAFAPILTAMP